MTDDPRSLLAQAMDAIEGAYEAALSYAAQGHEAVVADSNSDSIREYLEGAERALGHLGQRVRACVADPDSGAWPDFLEIVEADAGRARSTLALALAQPALSSELVDNLNASTHVRAVLTDLFLIDSVLKVSDPEIEDGAAAEPR